MRYAVNQMGAQRRTRLPAEVFSYFTEHGSPVDLHGHVLHTLGVTADTLGALCMEGVDVVYRECGFSLTEKALRLAQFSQEFEESWVWGDAVETAARLARQLDDTQADRRLGDAALLAVLRYVAHRQPSEMTPLPGWLPHDTPLFIDGYPTTLLGHAAADLHVDAVTATYLAEPSATELFHALGWQLSPRAQAVADVAQERESHGESWPDAITAAEQALLDHLERQEWDRWQPAGRSPRCHDLTTGHLTTDDDPGHYRG
ncbi:hypothetical protein ACFSXZ_00495 [Amycolatopsis pigmentata]|uniref:Transcriptional regulator n=1 Tax=Amycolatopsis pigmentata TaxID=450801 RepID=A0ABW5FLD0_9PSEU